MNSLLNPSRLLVKIYLFYGFSAAIILFIFQICQDFFIFRIGRFDLWVSLIALLFIGLGFWAGSRFKKQSKGEPINTSDSMNTTSPLSLLSRRETVVMEHLLLDKSNKEICESLCIENSTLKTHINRIYKKTGVQNRKELQSGKIFSL